MDRDRKKVAVLWPSLTEREEKALIIGLHLPAVDRTFLRDSLEELKLLAETAGTEVAGIEINKRNAPDPAFYIGSGKSEEIAEICREQDINVVIFDDDLRPAQAKNLQNLFGIKVIDRTELILDIFAQHAKSRTGKIQVELAQLQYMLPRLVHAWTHLSRQWGGVGTRGPGERQLELDRRRIRAQITKLKHDLKTVGSHRNLQRKNREKKGVPLVSITGYTNAGKTTIFNKITESDLTVENSLFTTLDTKVKKVFLPNKQRVLFSDTVGFIRKLPHHLVESFKATLEEVKEADIILHVIDGSSHNIEQKFDVVHNLLEELEAGNTPVVIALNKIDVINNDAVIRRLCRKFPVTVPVSAATGENINKLINEIQSGLKNLREKLEFFIPSREEGAVSIIYNAGNVIETDYTSEGVKVIAELPPQSIGELKKWIVKKL